LKIEPAVAVEMPNLKDIATTVARQRKIEGIPKLKPTSLGDLYIPDSFKHIWSGSGLTKFLQYDEGMESGPNRFIIFSTEQNLVFLGQVETVFSDGTFSITPPLFEQLYTIHGTINGSTYPLAYVLMPNKQQQTYESVLEKLKELAPNFNPSQIMTDFEKAAINAY